jgi:uncharacterized protein YodC (DUF2158 family)
MADIRAGDNVRLKLSGSPQMVVNAIQGNQVDVIYMTQTGHPEIIAVSKYTLKLTKQDGE